MGCQKRDGLASAAAVALAVVGELTLRYYRQSFCGCCVLLYLMGWMTDREQSCCGATPEEGLLSGQGAWT